MAVSHLRNTPITGKSYTTLADATLNNGSDRWPVRQRDAIGKRDG